MPTKPRSTVCWYCGKKLAAKKGGGYHYLEVELEGNFRILHKSCLDWYEEECLADKYRSAR